MSGAGFMKDMISSTKNNRSLLKGNDGAHFQNFDTSYITDSIISRKAPSYKEATPEYLFNLRRRLVEKTRTNALTRLKVLIFTVVITGILFILFLNSSFFTF